jgi:hypothetical protein
MAGTPSAFQGDAFQVTTFQTGPDEGTLYTGDVKETVTLDESVSTFVLRVVAVDEEVADLDQEAMAGFVTVTRSLAEEVENYDGEITDVYKLASPFVVEEVTLSDDTYETTLLFVDIDADELDETFDEDVTGSPIVTVFLAEEVTLTDETSNNVSLVLPLADEVTLEDATDGTAVRVIAVDEEVADLDQESVLGGVLFGAILVDEVTLTDEVEGLSTAPSIFEEPLATQFISLDVHVAVQSSADAVGAPLDSVPHLASGFAGHFMSHTGFGVDGKND